MHKALIPYQKKEVQEFTNRSSSVKPLVSIITITYNHIDYIQQCLDSLINQDTNFEFEILLGDDCSNDGTRELCIDYAKKYPSVIRLFLHERENNIAIDGRPSGRFNYVYNFTKAKGKYIAVCEGDDFWVDSKKLQKQIDFLEINPTYSFCWTRFNVLNNSTGELQLDFNGKYFSDDSDIVDFDFERSLKGWHIGNLTLVYKKEWLDISIHNKFKYFRDIYIIAQLLKKGNGACLNFVGAHYRQHGSGIHSSISVFEGFKLGYFTHREIYKDNAKNKFLKRKYHLSFQNYVNALIVDRQLLKAFLLNFKFLFIVGDVILFLKHIKRIVKAILR
ncbi:glycosyltransferase family 2 protein [uncultured Psychroserpens sp.]|uniref:glycosyltransferase family 2 protein n=1 Tax=uncultured Psychroserpens sp. TaxID=255436 RepID=UPI0026257870|nr:glycosyltransferase family 2 protein [uncultured Psychroserpens sp.]